MTAQDRERTLTDLDVIVGELLDEVTTNTLVAFAATGQAPRTDGRPTPKRVRHITHGQGLYVQLEQAAGIRPTAPESPRLELDQARSAFVATARRLGATVDEAARMVEGYATRAVPAFTTASATSSPRYGAEPTSHAKPGSRPPMSLDALELLASIDTDAVELRQRADKAAGIPTLTRARGFRGELRHLGWLLRETDTHDRPLLSDVWPRRVYSAARAWAADARVALSYLAPVATLNVTCPECGGAGTMRVRADASSDVWCDGRWDIEGPAVEGAPWPVMARCGAVWPRFTWVQLLDQVQGDTA